MNQSIGEALGLSAQDVQIEPEYQGDGVWAGFVGRACERVTRERGGSSFVAPIAELPQDLKAWLGLHEAWEVSERDIRQYTFRHLGLTVHFGFPGDPVKPQIFRSEWSGIRDWVGAGPSFQTPGAGHPHWQFDLLAALRKSKDELHEVGFVDAADEDEEIEDFEAEATEPNIHSLVQSATIERMHFASAAPWWTRQGANAHPLHMNAPADEASLSRWLLNCVAYLRQELARCEFRSAY